MEWYRGANVTNMTAVYEVWIKKTHKETWSPMLYASVLAMFWTIPGVLQAQSPVKIHVLGPSKLLLGLTETGHSLLKTRYPELVAAIGAVFKDLRTGQFLDRDIISKPTVPSTWKKDLVAQRAKSLIRHFLGTRHRILRANAGFGKTPSLARILAAKGPVSGIMFPVEGATPNNIDSRERFYDSLFAPTSNQTQSRGSLNDALWLNIFNHKRTPSTCKVLAVTVNDVLQQKGQKSSLNDLIKLTVECKHYVRPKVYEKLFRLLQSVLKKKCTFTMPRRVVLRTPTLCPKTERTIIQAVKSHFSCAPMPVYLQDPCKSVVSTVKRAPRRVCDVFKSGPHPISQAILRNCLLSANLPGPVASTFEGLHHLRFGDLPVHILHAHIYVQQTCGKTT